MHLDGFEDLLARAVGVVVETGQLADPPVQIGEAHPERIDVRMLLDEGGSRCPRCRST